MASLYSHKKGYRLLLVLILTLSSGFNLLGCAIAHRQAPRPLGLKLRPPSSFSKFPHLTDEDRSRLTEVAKNALGLSRLNLGTKSYRLDCSGTIRAIFAKANIRLGGIFKNRSDNDVKAIYRYVYKYGKIDKQVAKPGDLVFFHNTYDRSRNGRMNDPLTHVGLVEKVEGTTVHFIHHLGRSIIRSRMDLSMPNKLFHPDKNIRINHILRRAQGPRRAYTAAELFAGFGQL